MPLRLFPFWVESVFIHLCFPYPLHSNTYTEEPFPTNCKVLLNPATLWHALFPQAEDASARCSQPLLVTLCYQRALCAVKRAGWEATRNQASAFT